MMYIGIDPGISGAVVSIVDGAAVFCDTPTLEITTGSKVKRVIDVAAAAQLLRGLDPRNTYVTIEKVWAMPGGGSGPSMGATSAFNFGMGYGMWLGILAAYRLQYEQVIPATWKKVMMPGMGKDKDESRVRVMQLFPEASPHVTLKKHHGRADALLIAEYGRRTNHHP
jgi:hypothetical protein